MGALFHQSRTAKMAHIWRSVVNGVFRKASLLAAVGALVLALAAPAFAAPRGAEPGDVSLSVIALLPQDGTISAHEPIMAHLTLTNKTTEELEVPDYRLRLEVYDGKGRLVGETPREPLPLDLFAGILRLPAGGGATRWVVLSALYSFTVPGDYTVRVQQILPRKDLPVLAEAVTQVRVLPFDGPRLRARCDDLFAPWRSFEKSHAIPRSPDDSPATLRLYALYAIRHDAVLPYLSRIVREWGDTSERWRPLMAIRRIGSPQSEKRFRTLAARRDRVGKAARAVAKARLDEPDIGDTWRPEEPSPAPAVR